MADVGAPKNDIGYDLFSAPEASIDYMSFAKMGNALYAAFGDPYVVFNDNDQTGNAYVRILGRDWYTTSVTKGDWLYRKYGDSIIVYNNEGYPYARYDGDWYVSCLPRREYAPSQAENTIIKLNDSSIQDMMPEASKGTSSLVATNKSDFSLGSLSSTKYPQSDFSEYLDFTRKIQDHIGYPEPPTSQEIENNISWEVGPFDVFYKYKNGIMIPEHQEKLSEWKRELNTYLEKLSEGLDAYDFASNQVPAGPPHMMGGWLVSKIGVKAAKGGVKVGRYILRADEAVDVAKGPSNAAKMIDGINVVEGKVGGKIPLEEFTKIRNQSIHNANAEASSMTLGKYTPTVENGIENWAKPGPDSYIAKAGDKSTYFDLGSEWSSIQKRYNLTRDEMFNYFNRPALDDAVRSGKTIQFSHDPRLYSDSYLADEWKYLKDTYGYKTLIREGDGWIAK